MINQNDKSSKNTNSINTLPKKKQENIVYQFYKLKFSLCFNQS
jgi:hypothetical protein